MGSHSSYFIGFFAVGLFLAISLQTGYDISQEGIAILILQTLQSTFPVENQSFSFMVEAVIFLLIVIGIISPLIFGYAAYKKGYSYLGISLIGFFAGLSSLFTPSLFFILLIIGGLCSYYLE